MKVSPSAATLRRSAEVLALARIFKPAAPVPLTCTRTPTPISVGERGSVGCGVDVGVGVGVGEGVGDAVQTMAVGRGPEGCAIGLEKSHIPVRMTRRMPPTNKARHPHCHKLARAPPFVVTPVLYSGWQKAQPAWNLRLLGNVIKKGVGSRKQEVGSKEKHIPTSYFILLTSYSISQTRRKR